jgi:hypothetical protein
MRTRQLVFGVALAIGAIGGVIAGCSAGIAPASGDGGAEASTTDGSTTDGSPLTDASNGDAAIACAQLGGLYENAKACQSANECTTVARGCYCGAQPVIGIAKTFATAAQACETTAASKCALGCANMPGQTAEDGKNDIDGGTIEVLCDLGKCHTVLQ